MGSFMLLELVGTLREAQKLFFRNVKLMSSIFLLIISLSSILFVGNMFSIKLSTDLTHKAILELAMDADTPEFANLVMDLLKNTVRLFASLEWIFIFTFCFAWLFFATALILASAVTYCGEDLSIKELLSRAVKSLNGPFRITWFLVHLGYCLFCIAVLVPLLMSGFSIPAFLLVLVFEAYLALVWNLALIVSVLEGICGIEALVKAEQLIKGLKRRGFALNLLFGALSFSVFYDVLLSAANAAIIPLLLLNSMYCLIEMFKLMTYTVLYHECQETHGEELEMQGGTKVGGTPLISADAP